METKIVALWEENKHKLEEYLSSVGEPEHQNYDGLIEKFIIHLLPKHELLKVIYTESYRGGIIIFFAGTAYGKSYDRDEIYYSFLSYGSCSGCDTLEAILHGRMNKDNIKFSPEQVKDLMGVALNFIQNCKRITCNYTE